MFQFEDLTVVNYGYFPNTSFNDLEHGHTIITGENGAGKSTLVDAFLLVLGAKHMTHGRSANEHIGARSKQALLIAHVSNPVLPGKSKQRVWHEQQCRSDTVTIACRLTRHGSNPKRQYLILDGAVSEADVKERFKQDKGLGVAQYRTKLANIGITQETLEMLIIRQDLVATICQKKPRDLYDFILSMLGDPQVLKNYDEALAELNDLEDEKRRLEKTLIAEQHHLDFKKRELSAYETYADAKAAAEKYEARCEAAMLQIHFTNLDKADSAFQDVVAALETDDGLLVDAKQQLKEAEAQYAKYVQKATTIDADVADAAGKRKIAESGVRALEPSYDEYRTAQSIIKKSPKNQLDTSQAAAGKARQELQVAQDAFNAQENVVEELQRQRRLLEERRPSYPVEVEQFYNVLAEAGIDFTPVYSLVEPVGNTLEDSLGDVRYSVILADDARLGEAIKHSRACKFPASITSASQAEAGYNYGEVLDNAPEWLHESIKATKASRIGYEDQYGHWTRQSSTAVLGSRDWEAELQELESILLDAEQQLADVQSDLTSAREAAKEADRLVVKVETRVENEAIVAKHRDVERDYREAQTKFKAAQAAFNEVDAAKCLLTEIGKNRKTAVSDWKRQVDNLKKSTAKLAAKKGRHEKEYQSNQRLIDAAKDRLDGALYHEARQGKLGLPEQYGDLRDKQQRIMGGYEEEPSEAIVGIVASIQKNVTEYEANLEKREQERTDQIQSMEAARSQYIRLVNQLFSDYAKRLKEFEEAADVNIEAIPPRFTLDSTTDEDIRKAEFPVRIAFSGKSLMSISDQRLSGGQRTLAGLILLMALPEENSNGFFVIDEPYGNLSANRVENVASFIANTPLQIIITLPTNFDPGHYLAGSRVINVLEAKDGSKLAPHPQIGVVGA